MIYPVYIYGSSVLRKVAEDITPDYPNLSQLISNMFDTMYQSDGIGLAAPQVGLSIRLFVVDGTPLADDDPSVQSFKKVFINAHIVERFDEVVRYSEGCLSIPNIHEEVERESKIRIEVFRKEACDSPLCMKEELLAMATDTVIYDDVPHFSVDDPVAMADFLVKSRFLPTK